MEMKLKSLWNVLLQRWYLGGLGMVVYESVLGFCRSNMVIKKFVYL